MKRLIVLTMLLMVLSGVAVQGQVPETISYQGILTDGSGTPVLDGNYNLTFKIYTAASGGTEVWTETQSITVMSGVFSAVLGSVSPLAIPFDVAYWLGVAVDGGSELTPRRELTASAYSLNARSVEDNAVTAGKIAGGTVVRSLNTLTDDVTLAPGPNVDITASGDSLIISAGGGGGAGWNLAGNAGTSSATNFLGTTDAEGLQLRVNDMTVLRMEPGTVPSIIGGDAANALLSGPVGVVIAGGGNATFPNQATEDYSVVGGGIGNTAGDGDADATTAFYAVVSGGLRNQATATNAVIGGGETNTAGGPHSTIGGGVDNITSAHAATVAGGDGNISSGILASITGGNANQATAWESTVGGGGRNVASGVHATVPGGDSNTAAGGHSLAAGRRAKALHGGSFVWADSSANADFSTLRPDQFLIRASGGVGIGTNDPQQELDVAGSVKMAGFEMTPGAASGYVLTSDATGQGSWRPAPGGSAWGLAGNTGTTAGTNFLGTTDSVALELRVNNARAFALIPGGTSPNIVGGHSSNVTSAAAWGQTIAGGGELVNINRATDAFCTIGGGAGNQAGNNDGSPVNTSYATVAGGQDNRAFNEYTFVGGGLGNSAQGSFSVIAGGENNLTNNVRAFIGGGSNNQVIGNGGTVGGGTANLSMSNYATVAGGAGNTVSGLYATIGGGFQSTASGERATVAGGSQNFAIGRASSIGGGEGNQIEDQRGGAIGGGWNNRVWGLLGTIAGGGRMNLADGGTANRVTDDYGTVGGGGNNQAGNGSGLTTDAQFATVGGGRQNLADGAQATVAGGNFNVASGTNATVAGGSSNNALALNSTVGGGAGNLADGADATVAGGAQNQAHGSKAATGGGGNNVVDGDYATVPGGRHNAAGGDFSFAAGFRAKIDTLHAGAFVFADQSNFDFNSAAQNEFAARATGGVRFVSGIDGTGAPTSGVVLPAGGGAWSPLSDRNAKENFVPVDGVEVLNRLAEMELSTWNYKSQDAAIRHIGPMAQDFYAAFNVGEDDKRISTVDADGVALAAIQGLKQMIDRKDARISELERRVAELEKAVALMVASETKKDDGQEVSEK